MEFIFILMFLFIIIAPFIYFLYIFRHLSKITKISAAGITIFSLITIMIKLFFHPYSTVFLTLTTIVQFYIITVFIIFILFGIYQLICYCIHKPFVYWTITGLIIFSILLTSISYLTHYSKVETNYEITIHKETTLKELHIGMISDIHLGTGTSLSDLRVLVDKFNHKQYDLVCFVGDIFDESTPKDMIEDALSIFSQIKTTYGLFAVNGNHEHYANILQTELYQKYNIYHLSEKYVCVDGLFNIVGREDVVAHLDNKMNNICQGMNTNLPTILLDHNPKRYQDVLHYADLQLSGHTHAGQFFPVTLLTAPLYDNVYGLLQKNHFSLIVTSGYGSWGFPMRFLTNCEFVDIKIAFTKK